MNTLSKTAAALGLAFAFAACAQAHPAPSSFVPRIAHITLVLMENHSSAQLIGNPQAPYLNALVGRGALMSDSHAVTHPSLPNYLALFSGSTQGVDDDRCPATFPGPSIAGELLAAHLTFKAYAENIPSTGWTGCRSSDGLYARKHVPSMYFSDVPAWLAVSYTRMPGDMAGGTYPDFAFVTPNMCHDTHDCPIPDGDAWMSAALPAIMRYDATHDGLLILTWDENDRSPGNHIVTLLVGPMVRPGSYHQTIDHYGVLRTIEAAVGVAPLGASASAEPIHEIWRP